MSPQKSLRNAFGNFGTGVAVIAVKDTTGCAIGLTVNSFASVSLEPPLLSWCLANDSQLFASLKAAERFSVNILAADQQALSDRMAMPGDHRFADEEWDAAGTDGIFVKGALAQFDCRVAQRIDAGDHVIFIGQIETAQACSEGRAPLLYFRGAYAALAGDPS